MLTWVELFIYTAKVCGCTIFSLW